MIHIYIGNRELDIDASAEIEMQMTNFRYTGDVREAFTNDFEIPKTTNNLQLLDIYTMVDGVTQPLGTKKLGVLVFGENMMDVDVQVVEVNTHNISICVFERILPKEISGRKVNAILPEHQPYIFIHNAYTGFDLSGKYHYYDYMPPFNKYYAIPHPSLPLSSVSQQINNAISPYRVVFPETDYMQVCSGMIVSPHNHRQVVEVEFDEDGNPCISGGQHITNDLKWSESGTDCIKFNRACNVSMTIWLYYSTKGDRNRNGVFSVGFDGFWSYPGRGKWIPIGTDYTSLGGALTVYGFNVQEGFVEAGSELRFMVQDYSNFNGVSAIIAMEITDYEFDDGDFGTEMLYVGRYPRLKTIFWWSSTSEDGYKYIVFDGNVHTYNLPQHVQQIEIPTVKLGYCYYDINANLTACTLSDYLYNLQYVFGKKLRFRNNVIDYVDCDTNATIEKNKNITNSYTTIVENLGKKNYILYGGEKPENAKPISTVNNDWLENEHVIFESKLERTIQVNQTNTKLTINQYEKDDDSYKYIGEGEHIIIASSLMNNNTLVGFTIKKMGFDKINQSVKINVSAIGDFTNLDYITLDGHVFMVVDTSYNYEHDQTTINALLTRDIRALNPIS